MLPEKYICILHRIVLCLSWCFLNLNFSHQVQESKKSSLPVNTSIIWVSSYSSCIYFSKISPTKNGWVRAFKTLWVEWCLHQKGHWTEMCSCCLCVWNSLSIQLIYGEGGEASWLLGTECRFSGNSVPGFFGSDVFAAFDASWEVHIGSDGLSDFTESAISKIKMTPFQWNLKCQDMNVKFTA